MTDPKIGDDGLVFEDRPLPIAVLQSIPSEVGLWKTTVVYTCLEANEDYVVVGSEQGHVWVVDLETNKLVKEYNEFRGVAITAVKLCPTRDLIAYGTNDGHVRIEKVARPMTNKWRVQEKDKQSVSALEWTQTGDELYCGFALGRVIRLRLNIHDGTMTPMTFPGSYGSHVTQLSCRGESLLISTVERTWIVHTQTHKLEQVGRKDRKPGHYGGCLIQGGEKAYVARPGLRLWSADNTGKVLRTMVYKEALTTQHLPRVPLHSWSSLVPTYNKAWQFSSVQSWVGEHFVVTLADHTLFVLDPEKGIIVGVLSLGHPISGYAITRAFIYLMCNDLKKPICRISVKQSFLKVLRKSLPVSPSLSPRISPARKNLPLHENAPQSSSSLLTPTDRTEENSRDLVATTPEPSAEKESGNSEGAAVSADAEVVLKSNETSEISSVNELDVKLPAPDSVSCDTGVHEESQNKVNGDSQPDHDNFLIGHFNHPDEYGEELTSNDHISSTSIEDVSLALSGKECVEETMDDLPSGNQGDDVSDKLQELSSESLRSEQDVSLIDPSHKEDCEVSDTVQVESTTSQEEVPTHVEIESISSPSHDILLSDIVESSPLTVAEVTEGNSSQHATDEPQNIETENVVENNEASKITDESQTEQTSKTGLGSEQTLQDALSNVKAEMKELFKPKFDKLSNIFKVNNPGSLSPGRLRVLASRGGKDEKEQDEEIKKEEKTRDLEVHIEDDKATPLSVSPIVSKQEKSEQEQARKPDLKDILKFGRIGNLLNKEMGSNSSATPTTATPSSTTVTPVIVTPAPLDPLEQQRRLMMSKTNQGEEENDLVVVTKTHHKKRRKRRHKKLSSATSSVSVSLEQLTEIGEEYEDSPTPLSSIATPNRTASPCGPFMLTDEQRAKLESIKRERNTDSESKSVEKEQVVLESLPETHSDPEDPETESSPIASVDQPISIDDQVDGSVSDTTNKQVDNTASPTVPSDDNLLTGQGYNSETDVGVVTTEYDNDQPVVPDEVNDKILEEPTKDQAPPTLDLLFEDEESSHIVNLSKSHSPGVDSVAGSREKSMTTTLGDLSDNPLYHDSDHELDRRKEKASPDTTRQVSASPSKNLLSTSPSNSRSRLRATIPRYQSSVLQPVEFDPLQSDESFEGLFGGAGKDLLTDATPVKLRPRLLSDSPEFRNHRRRVQVDPIVPASVGGFASNRETREASGEASDSSHEEDDNYDVLDSQVVPDFYQLCGSLVRHSNQRKEAKDSLTSRFSWANSAFQRESIIESGDEDEEEESASNADIWVPIPHPGRSHLRCIFLSDVLLWVVDGRGSVFCTTTASKGKDWQLIKKSMQQVSSSPSGRIVWGMNHQNAYVRLGIGMNPAGSTWKNTTKGTTLSRKIKRIAVDENAVWAITTDSKTIFRKGVEESNPEGRVWQEVSGEGFSHIACCKSIVWAHTNLGKVFIRDGITPSTPSGKKWMESKCPKLTAACITNAGVAWGINNEGSIGFRSGVCSSKPGGKGPWWEIKINALTHPSSPYNSFWQVMGAEGSHILTSVSSLLPHTAHHQSKPLSLSASSKAGVIILQDGNRLHACWRTATGYHYRPASKNGIFPLTTWSNLAASATGLWLVRDDGDLYCLTADDKLKRIECPAAVTHLASSSQCLWIVADNLVWSRQGFCSELPEGVSFDYIEVSPQLHERKLRYIACGKTAVWALDKTGIPHFRFGVHSREPGTGMSPAWIPVEDIPGPLLQIAVCPDNWLVWACDEKYNAYVRTGVTHDFPIGRSWEHIPGEQIRELVATNEKIYGLTPGGELLCRYGLFEGNVQGNYWRRMPGRYEHITTGAFGELWTLDAKGQVWKQEWKVMTVSHDPKSGQNDFEQSMVVDQSWEVV